MDNLTDKEFDVYFAIKDFIRLNQYPPTVRELCSILGYKSPATLWQYINQLKDKGYIYYPPKKNRAIRILK